MTSKEMDEELGLTNRMRKVANNLRKFNQLEGEKANLQKYHYDMIDKGVEEIQKEGVKEDTIKGDYSIMKRYGLING